jgi:predicted SAM-dependent methyltransferase
MAKNNAKIAEKNRRKIDALMESNNPVKLELGADQNRGIVGWTYVDMNGQCDLTLDLLQPLPFPDNCVEMIYSSHLLEHFRYPDLINLLNECLRILKPGGIFSAAIPNARLYLEAYHNPADFDPSLFCRYEPAYHYHSKIDYVNYMAYMDGHHHYMFDEDNIDAILRKTGFKTVRPREFDKNLDMEVRNFQTIYVHCEK